MTTLFYQRVVRLALCAAVLIVGVSMSALAQDGPPTGRIVHIDPAGKLKVKQRRSDVFVDATVGMIVRRGYMLDLDLGAKATVKCADDGKFHQLEPRSQGCPCVTPAPRNDGLLSVRAGAADTAARAFPIIISPRGTLLLTTRPVLRWSPVTALAQGTPVEYHVSVHTKGIPIWKKVVTSQTQLEYPAGEKALTRGEVYKIIVEARGQRSEWEGSAGMGFRILTDGQAKDIGDAETRIRNLNLPAAETQFLIAELFATRGLSSEAIDKLNALKSTLNQPWVLLMLGDLYAAAGLHREAIDQYKSALARPQTVTDLEAHALALVSLGRSYLSLGEFEDADAIFPKASDAYLALGIKVTLQQLKKGNLE